MLIFSKMIKLKLQKIDYFNHKKTPFHNTTQANANNFKTSHKILTIQRNRNNSNSKDQLPLININKSNVNNNIQQQSQFFTSNFLKVNNKEKQLSSSVKQIVAVKNNVVSEDNSREENNQMNQDVIENSFINEIKDLLENGNEKNTDIKYYYKSERLFTDKPTVLILCSYYSDFYKKINLLNSKACIIEYSEFVPCIYIPKNGDLNLKDYLNEISKRAKPYLEKIVEYMNPYVIVSDNDYFEVLKQTYGISNGEIEINNNIYPIYNIDDINEYKEEIIQLANQEYRGIYYPMVISQEEMQELEKENIAIKIKD